MLLELLVIGSCVSQHGCNETTNAYYDQSKELQQLAKNAEAYGNRLVRGNEWLVFAATPGYMLLSGQTANVKLHKNWSLDLNAPKKYTGIRWNW